MHINKTVINLPLLDRNWKHINKIIITYTIIIHSLMNLYRSFSLLEIYNFDIYYIVSIRKAFIFKDHIAFSHSIRCFFNYKIHLMVHLQLNVPSLKIIKFEFFNTSRRSCNVVLWSLIATGRAANHDDQSSNRNWWEIISVGVLSSRVCRQNLLTEKTIHHNLPITAGYLTQVVFGKNSSYISKKIYRRL